MVAVECYAEAGYERSRAVSGDTDGEPAWEDISDGARFVWRQWAVEQINWFIECDLAPIIREDSVDKTGVAVARWVTPWKPVPDDAP